MKDGEFEQAKSFTVQTKGFRQRGKKNKPNDPVALTEEKIKLRHNKESFYLTSLRPLTTVCFNKIHFGLSGMQLFTGLFYSFYVFLLSPGNL